MTLLTAALAVIAAGAAVAADRPGRVLLACAALALAAYAGSDIVFSPRLHADALAIDIRSPGGRASLPWADIAEIRVDSRLRHGLRSVTLEIDTELNLYVFSRRALGEQPETVAEQLRAMDPRGRG